MRTTRAFVASIGAGMSLVAASVTVLFVLSTIVAVRGWPGIDPSDDVPAIVLSDALPGGAPGAALAAVPTDAADAAAPIVLGGPDDAGAGEPAGDAPPQRRGPVARTPAETGAPITRTGPAAAAPGPTPSRGPAPQAATRPAAPQSPAATAIRDAGETVTTITDPVAPAAGEPVREITDTVADTVEATGLGSTVERVTGGVGSTVERTTGSVGRTVERVQGTVDGVVGSLLSP